VTEGTPWSARRGQSQRRDRRSSYAPSAVPGYDRRASPTRSRWVPIASWRLPVTAAHHASRHVDEQTRRRVRGRQRLRRNRSGWIAAPTVSALWALPAQFSRRLRSRRYGAARVVAMPTMSREAARSRAAEASAAPRVVVKSRSYRSEDVACRRSRARIAETIRSWSRIANRVASKPAPSALDGVTSVATGRLHPRCRIRPRSGGR
jgi:hypothetical protein